MIKLQHTRIAPARPTTYAPAPQYLAPASAMGALPAPAPTRALGATDGCPSSIWPFVAGMVVWAFFGEPIKGALHLGKSAANLGIQSAGSRLQAIRN